MLRALPLMLDNRKPPLECNHTAGQTKVLVGAMFSFEVDTLEAALDNYCGLADVILAEGVEFHQPQLRLKDQRPILWPRVRRNKRFHSLRNVVVQHVTCGPSHTRDMWGAESHMNSCLSRALQARTHTGKYKSVVVGSVDEILSRAAIAELNRFPARQPTSATSGFFLSLATSIFRSDWPKPNLMYSFSTPSIYPATSKHFERSLPSLPGTRVFSGAHLSNYCFWPNRIIKEASATEYQGKFDRCSADAEPCYAMLKSRTRPWTSLDTHAVLPRALTKDRYPAWYGLPDPREVKLKRLLGTCI